MADKLTEEQSNDFFLEFDKTLHAEKIEKDGKQSSDIGMNSYTKQPYSGTSYTRRGVWDLTNPFQFAPYESGYCMLAVLSSPAMFNTTTTVTSKDHNGKEVKSKVKSYNNLLQKAFVRMLENEFKGLDGIEDITTETMETSDNISTMSLISKSVQNTNSQISMRFTEKTGSLITKYISTFIRTIKDPRTQAKTYGGIITKDKLKDLDPGPRHEVFNMLYIVTDSTCLRIEKAFLILNAQPTNASFSDLYTAEKGAVESKEVTVQFNAFVVDGNIANKLASAYVRTLINTTDNWQEGKINVNSWNFNWSFADGNGEIKKINDLNVDSVKGKLDVNGDFKVGNTYTRPEGA